MRVSLVLGTIGRLLRSFALAFIVPALLATVDAEWNSAIDFALSGLVALGTGSLLTGLGRPESTFYRAEAFAIVTGTWSTLSAFAATPYVLAGLSPIDAMFESVSGLTTTGATILQDFDAHGRAFFLWRAMTQWFGGLGVIALFVVVLPRLGIAGRQLFFAEASGASAEALSPQVRKNAGKLWLLYCALTSALALSLYASGFSVYEAIVHALTTLSAGGFSPNAASIAGYANPAAEWFLVIFMVLSGTSFTMQYRVLSGTLGDLVRDGEFVTYLVILCLVGVALATQLGDPLSPSDLRPAFFQAASLMSSTGFASVDYNLWPDRSRSLLLVVMLVGGCAGSAAGGPKVIRLLLTLKYAAREIRRALHPRAVLPLRYKSRPVSDDVMRSVLTLVVLYFLGYLALGVTLSLMGHDLILSFTAALACMGNVGPGFGAAGPMGNFASFDSVSKALLTLAMGVGRLEIVAVLSLLQLDVWRYTRWR